MYLVSYRKWRKREGGGPGGGGVVKVCHYAANPCVTISSVARGLHTVLLVVDKSCRPLLPYTFSILYLTKQNVVNQCGKFVMQKTLLASDMGGRGKESPITSSCLIATLDLDCCPRICDIPNRCMWQHFPFPDNFVAYVCRKVAANMDRRTEQNWFQIWFGDDRGRQTKVAQLPFISAGRSKHRRVFSLFFFQTCPSRLSTKPKRTKRVGNLLKLTLICSNLPKYTTFLERQASTSSSSGGGGGLRKLFQRQELQVGTSTARHCHKSVLTILAARGAALTESQKYGFDWRSQPILPIPPPPYPAPPPRLGIFQL